MASNPKQQQQIISRDHQFKHTHIQLGVLMMAKRLESRICIQKHVPSPRLVTAETIERSANIAEPDGKVAKERRNSVGRRKSFAVDQLLGLEFHYSQSRYLKGKRRNIVAEQLKLSENQVKIWFQNRRAKENRYRRLMTKEDGKRLDEIGLQKLQAMLSSSPPPPRMLPTNVMSLETQKQPKAPCNRTTSFICPSPAAF